MDHQAARGRWLRSALRHLSVRAARRGLPLGLDVLSRGLKHGRGELLLCLGLALLGSPARAVVADAYTGVPLNLALPADDSFDWGSLLRFNFQVTNDSFTVVAVATTTLGARVATLEATAVTLAASTTSLTASVSTLQVWQGTSSIALTNLAASTTTLSASTVALSVRLDSVAVDTTTLRNAVASATTTIQTTFNNFSSTAGAHLAALASSTNTIAASTTTLFNVRASSGTNNDITRAIVLADAGTAGASLTIRSSFTVTDAAGIRAGIVSVTNGLTASSGTFLTTGANQYSVQTASGISVQAGTLNAAGSGGITATYGVKAASAIIGVADLPTVSSSFTVLGTDGAKASSFSATGTGTTVFSMTSSSGIHMMNGRLDLEGTGAFIRFPDGTTQKTAPVASAGATYASSHTVVLGGVMTNTALGPCLAGTTITFTCAGSNPAYITFSSTFYQAVTSESAFWFLYDNAFGIGNPYGGTGSVSRGKVYSNPSQAFCSDAEFSIPVNCAAGSHTICLTAANSSSSIQINGKTQKCAYTNTFDEAGADFGIDQIQ